MQLDTQALGHLTYCTNIHAANNWPDVLTNLKRYLPAIKAEFCPIQPMGVGLCLSASAAASLQDPAAFAELHTLLKTGNYYVFTLNGFVYGAFHNVRVKENAYRPDWSEQARLDYTNSLADILAKLLSAGMVGSVSTVPGTFKPWVKKDGFINAIAGKLIAHVAHLVRLKRETDKTIVLTLEPEPHCLLETSAETVTFFTEYLFSKHAVRELVSLTDLSNEEAADALHLHIGVCYDVCHAAVEFENPHTSIAALKNAGIAITKLQLSSALRVSAVNPTTGDRLRPFDEPVYLHQVVQRQGGRLTRYVDLADALKYIDQAAGAEWRIHYHVPIFLNEMKNFNTTQTFLCEILKLHRERPIAPHLEVETYTWDVLPDGYRNISVSAAVARELNWVKNQLV